MSRFFIDRSCVDREAGRLIITGDDVNHIKNVLRAVSGEKLIVSDGSGSEYSVGIESIEKDRITALIIDVFFQHNGTARRYYSISGYSKIG